MLLPSLWTLCGSLAPVCLLPHGSALGALDGVRHTSALWHPQMVVQAMDWGHAARSGNPAFAGFAGWPELVYSAGSTRAVPPALLPLPAATRRQRETGTTRRSGPWTPPTASHPPESVTTQSPGPWCSPWTGEPGVECGELESLHNRFGVGTQRSRSVNN